MTAARQHVVISAIGADRVGLVEEIAGLLAEQQANIEDSKMAALCGEFAIILLASVPEDGLGRLLSQREMLEQRTHLRVSIRRAAGQAPTAARPYLLTASCLDHPGVVHRLTRVAADAGINIDSMETRTVLAPESGAEMFHFEARLSVPEDADVTDLAARFRKVAKEKDIEVEFGLVSR